ncbi:hypothetical protein PHAVU_004G100414 [Phaseolus vulgaris]
MVMLLHYGTCFNLRSTTQPLVCKAQCFVLVILCGYGLWWRFVVEVVVHASCFVLYLLLIDLWFMLRASSYTFFSSIRDSWFILKVVVRSMWQCASSVCPCDALKKGGRDEANAWYAEIKINSRRRSYQMMQSCQDKASSVAVGVQAVQNPAGRKSTMLSSFILNCFCIEISNQIIF